MTVTAQSPYIQVSPQSAFVDPGVVAIGGILFSAIATTVTISFFLSGLKQGLSELNSRINQIALETKAANEQILLRMSYKEEALRTLEKKYERLENYIRGITHHVEFEE